MSSESKVETLKHSERLVQGAPWSKNCQARLEARKLWKLCVSDDTYRHRPVNPDRIKLQNAGITIGLPEADGIPTAPTEPTEPTIAELAALVDDNARDKMKESYKDNRGFFYIERGYHLTTVNALENSRKRWDDDDKDACTFLLSTLDNEMIAIVRGRFNTAQALYNLITAQILDASDEGKNIFENMYKFTRQGYDCNGDISKEPESVSMYIERLEEYEECLRLLGRVKTDEDKIAKLLDSITSNLKPIATYCRNTNYNLDQCKLSLKREANRIKDAKQLSANPAMKQLEAKNAELEKQIKMLKSGAGAEKAMSTAVTTAKSNSGKSAATTSTKPSSGAAGAKSNKTVICGNCGKPGHPTKKWFKNKKCPTCNKMGHPPDKCFQNQICTICRIKGHIAKYCPDIKSSDPGSDRNNLHADDDSYFIDHNGLCMEILCTPCANEYATTTAVPPGAGQVFSESSEPSVQNVFISTAVIVEEVEPIADANSDDESFYDNFQNCGSDGEDEIFYDSIEIPYHNLYESDEEYDNDVDDNDTDINCFISEEISNTNFDVEISDILSQEWDILSVAIVSVSDDITADITADVWGFVVISNLQCPQLDPIKQSPVTNISFNFMQELLVICNSIGHTVREIRDGTWFVYNHKLDGSVHNINSATSVIPKRQIYAMNTMEMLPNNGYQVLLASAIDSDLSLDHSCMVHDADIIHLPVTAGHISDEYGNLSIVDFCELNNLVPVYVESSTAYFCLESDLPTASIVQELPLEQSPTPVHRIEYPKRVSQSGNKRRKQKLANDKLIQKILSSEFYFINANNQRGGNKWRVGVATKLNDYISPTKITNIFNGEQLIAAAIAMGFTCEAMIQGIWKIRHPEPVVRVITSVTDCPNNSEVTDTTLFLESIVNDTVQVSDSSLVSSVNGAMAGLPLSLRDWIVSDSGCTTTCSEHPEFIDVVFHGAQQKVVNANRTISHSLAIGSTGEYIPRTLIMSEMYVDLLSISQLASSGVSTMYVGDNCIMTVTDTNEILSRGQRHNGLYYHLKKDFMPTWESISRYENIQDVFLHPDASMMIDMVPTMIVGTRPANAILLYHQRANHIGYYQMLRQSRLQMVKGCGFTYEELKQHGPFFCHFCAQTKLQRLPVYKSVSDKSPPPPGVHWCVDLKGPMQRTFSKYIFCFDAIDVGTMTTVHYPMKHKDELPQCLQRLQSMVKSMQKEPIGIRILQSDAERVIILGASAKFCDDNSIKMTHSAPYVKEQNGQIESAIKTDYTTARTLLLQANLRGTYWDHALHYTSQTRFVTVTSIGHGQNKTPFFLWHGYDPDVSYLRTFGSTAYALVPKEARLGYFNPTSIVGTFLTYTDNSKGVYNIMHNQPPYKIYPRKDVIFLEDLRVLDPVVDPNIHNDSPPSTTQVYSSDPNKPDFELWSSAGSSPSPSRHVTFEDTTTEYVSSSDPNLLIVHSSPTLKLLIGQLQFSLIKAL